MRRFLVIAVAALGCNDICGYHSGTLCEASSTDPQNCGACGHDCLGGKCVDGTCQPVMLASGLDYPSALALDDANAYWVDYDTPAIATLGKDGTCADGSHPGDTGCPTQLAPTKAFVDVHQPRSIASDGTNVFWSNYDPNIPIQGVYERSPDGAFTRLGASGAPGSVAVGADGLVYWTNLGDPSAVVRARPGVAGSAVTLVTHAGTAVDHGDNGITVDATNVYWTDWVTGGVYATPLDQPCVQETTCVALYIDATCNSSCFGGLFGPTSLVMDATTLYWTNTFDSTIKRVNKDGTGEATLAIGQGQAQALAIDHGELFWGNYSDSTIRTMKTTDPPCDATSCKVLATDQVFPYGIAVDDRAIYWTTQRASGTVLTMSGALTRLAR